MNIKYIPLDVLKISDIRRSQKRQDEILDYFYDHYSYFNNARSKILGELKDIVIQQSEKYEFDEWVRCMPYKYSDNPLSARGSVLTDPGGRFNIGDIDKLKFPSFPALYIAETFEVAYRERNQAPAISDKNGLTSDELALSNKDDFVKVRVSGELALVFDLTKPRVLQPFYEAISDIKLPTELMRRAKKLNIEPLPHVSSAADLRNSILTDSWRVLPMQVDVPSNSQIFGHILNLSRVEGIIYPSRMKEKHKCAAIFIESFENSNSKLCLSGDAHQSVSITCLNERTWQYLC